MGGRPRHAQQRIGKLRFDAYKFLQFGKIHVLEGGHFHDSCAFVS
jgi:hypothetical protein